MPDGYRAPYEVALPDVTLTGDEFLHLMALEGELLPSSPNAHFGPPVALGMLKPGCVICESIHLKREVFMEECERRGAG